jgi:arsenate reductase
VAAALPEQASTRDGKTQLTVFLDPSCPASDEVLSELHAAGYEPLIVDYIENPPTKDQLRNLAILLRGGNHSLVKKYDPLFLELRLDDRFISDSEFWDSIIEHPFLINGPVVATATSAGVCSSGNAVKAFIATALNGSHPTAKPKGLPERLLRLVAGDSIEPAAPGKAAIGAPETVPEIVPESVPVETVPEMPDVTPAKKTLVKAEAKTEAKPGKPESKSKATPKAKAAPVGKDKKPATARKPSRESRSA